jgi:hypothetical protein
MATINVPSVNTGIKVELSKGFLLSLNKFISGEIVPKNGI